MSSLLVSEDPFFVLVMCSEFGTLLSYNANPFIARSDRFAPRFGLRSRTFNGKIIPRQKLVVSPLDAEDVSTIVKFCVNNGLSPSVRAGGYGIAGWAVAGDVVIDMSLMKEIDIEPPAPEEEGGCRWTRLKDMLAPGSKGKGRAGAVKEKSNAPSVEQLNPGRGTGTSTKRRREDEDDNTTQEGKRDDATVTYPEGQGLPMQSYDNASHVVAAFLNGPPLPLEQGEMPRQPPTNRRRLHSPEPAEQRTAAQLDAPSLDTRQISSDSTVSSSGGFSFGSGAISRTTSTGTAMTSPVDTAPDSDRSLPFPHSIPQPPTTAGPFGYAITNPPPPRPSRSGASDPFGYMANSASVGGFPSMGSFGGFAAPGGPGRSFAIPPNLIPALPGFAGALGVPQPNMGGTALPRPIHTHAYVTFGAGARQKEVDLYTAENPLEGISGVTGEREDRIVPYHVPSSVHLFNSMNYV